MSNGVGSKNPEAKACEAKVPKSQGNGSRPLEAAYAESSKAELSDRRAQRSISPFAMPAIIILALGIMVFLTAGTVSWWQGWTFLAIYALFLATSAGCLKKNPALFARRSSTEEDAIAKKPPAFLNLFFLCFIIPGLDHRFVWSSVPLWLIIASDVMIVLGCLIIVLVFRENAYASASIRTESGQSVIAAGPYRIVRHPMYLGIILMVVFTPLGLGSWWGLIPALLVIPMNVIRLIGEEELLRAELPGYQDYCKATRYRLFPGIW